MADYFPSREALAWAAGFFDGEGTAVLTNTRPIPSRIGVRSQERIGVRLAVTQHYRPDTVIRFHESVGGLGRITGPHSSKGTAWHPRWDWSATRIAHVLAVVPMLWPFLSEPKRDQIERCMLPWIADLQVRRNYTRQLGS